MPLSELSKHLGRNIYKFWELSELVAGCLLLVACCWLLVAGCWFVCY